MKIKSFNKGIIDTDKMSDVQAELGESIEAFKEFVSKRNGDMFVWAKVPGQMGWSSANMVNTDSVVSLVQSIDFILRQATSDKIGMMLLPVYVITALKKELGNGDEKDNL